MYHFKCTIEYHFFSIGKSSVFCHLSLLIHIHSFFFFFVILQIFIVEDIFSIMLGT